MVFLNIPLFIISAFLILTLLVGIYFSRKKTTFREYAVGNKNFATPTLVATVLATTFGGGGLVRNVECVHNLGLYWIVLLLLNSLGLWVISRLALRMGSFMHHLSIAETIGSVYGKYPRVISALIIVCSSIIAITGQITVMAKAISICLILANPYVMPIVAAMLLIFYSTFGGIRAVTFTDVLQFLTFSIIIPLLTWFIFKNIGKPIVEVIPILQGQPRFQLSSIFHSNTKVVGMFLFFLSCLLWYIHPAIIQRVYMSSRPIQAQKSFLYATIFSFIITIFIILIGLFVFVGSPNLLMTDVWNYIISNVPLPFKGFLAIGLIATAMSTADSCLNACSVIMSHDIIKIIQKRKQCCDAYDLKVARATTILVGIFAMLLAFRFQNLLKIMYLSFDYVIPTITTPFIFSIFGFRSSSRTALIGMLTGLLTILSWNKWIEPATAINGSFIAMLANSLAMLAAHYLFKQPEGSGWVGPDQEFKQIQQANAGKRAEQKEAIKNGWANRKSILSKLIPSHTMIVSVGLYSTITSLLTYFIAPIGHHGSRVVLQLVLAACLVGYPFIYDTCKKIRAIPNWLVGLCWLINMALYLPLSLLSHWYHLVAPFFTISLSLSHCAVILWTLPLYIGTGIVATTLLLAIYPIATGLPFAMLCDLLPFFLATLLFFSIIICLKINQYRYTNQILYLKDQEEIRASHQVKSSLYDAALIPPNVVAFPKGYGSILTQVIAKIEESISFLDSKIPIYKDDFQTIINKLYDWASYFNRREKAKNHALLQLTSINFNKLIRKVEHALSQEVVDPPRLLLERIRLPSKETSSDIVCDINQVVCLLVKAVLRVAKAKKENQPVLRIQLRPTVLKFK